MYPRSMEWSASWWGWETELYKEPNSLSQDRMATGFALQNEMDVDAGTLTMALNLFSAHRALSPTGWGEKLFLKSWEELRYYRDGVPKVPQQIGLSLSTQVVSFCISFLTVGPAFKVLHHSGFCCSPCKHNHAVGQSQAKGFGQS